MAVSDLTGYTWVGNNSLNLSNGNYALEFTSNGIPFTFLIIVGDSSIPSPYGLGVTYQGNVYTERAYSNNGNQYVWVSEAYKTIEITGGTSVTNSTLIAWLEANGTLTPPVVTAGSISIGSSPLQKCYVGNNEAQKIYIGDKLVYEKQAPAPVMPAKGDIINIDMTGSGTPQQYRVLKINDSVAEVLSMNAPSTQKFASSGQTYENSILDTYLNTTWYNTLSSTAKAAIIDKTFRQDSWYFGTQGNPVYQGIRGGTGYQISLDNASYGNEIIRHCYVLSVQDVLDYLEVTPQMTQADTTLADVNVWTMFWNSTTSHSGNLWLRSARTTSNNNSAFYVTGNNGNLSFSSTDYTGGVVRPAFQIDLSKIDYTIS